MPRPKIRFTVHLVSTLGLLTLTFAAVAAVDRVAKGPPARARVLVASGDPSASEEAPVARAGLRVVMDRATGTVVRQPTREQLGRLAPESPFVLRRKAEELRSFPIPAGGRGVALEGWGVHALQVRRDEDGGLRVVCSQGDDHGSGR